MIIPVNGIVGLRQEFERCWPWLEAALVRRGPLPTHSKEHIWQRIINRNALLFPGDNCAILAEVLNYPTGVKHGNGWLAGGDLDELLLLIPQLEQYAAHIGCHRVILDGRRGWSKVLDGYKEFGTRIGKDICSSGP